MSLQEEWKKSLEDEIERCNDFLKKSKDIADLVPSVEERKREAEAKLLFVRKMPESVLTELGKPLFIFQRHNEEQLRTYLPGLTPVDPAAKLYMTSGTTDSSYYLEIVQTYRNSNAVAHPPYDTSFAQTDVESVEQVHTAFRELAEERSNKRTLPYMLNNINRDLGDKFVVAQESYLKAKNGIVGIDQSAIQLRDVIEQLWGGIVLMVREKDPKRYKGVELNLDNKGKSIAIDCLSGGIGSNAQQLARLLESMTTIKRQLSDTNFGKNPLTKDVEKLTEIYNQWTLVVSGVAAYLTLTKVFG